MKIINSISLHLIYIFIKLILPIFENDIWKIKDLCNENLNNTFKRSIVRYYYSKLSKFGSWIGHEAIFISKPVFPHQIFGIFISNNAQIGKNCVIFHQVTIGSNNIIDSKRRGSPTIGNDCYIGAGAKLIGNIKIGNNCRIGANCVIVEDIPDNTVVVLNKPRQISKPNLDNRYFSINSKNQTVYYKDNKWHQLK